MTSLHPSYINSTDNSVRPAISSFLLHVALVATDVVVVAAEAAAGSSAVAVLS